MDERDWLEERFEANRGHLRAVAHRMLGSEAEADEAVHEASLRLSLADTSHVESLGAWLTTVVSRVSLDMLCARRSGHESTPTAHRSGVILGSAETLDPEQEALLGDSVGLALLAALDTLTAEERVAFVLHEIFAVPFDRIAPIMNGTPTAARQLMNRARRRVRGAASHGGHTSTEERV